MPSYIASRGPGPRAQRDADALIIPMARHLAELEEALADAYWTGEEREIELLRKRIQNAKEMSDSGVDFYTRF